MIGRPRATLCILLILALSGALAASQRAKPRNVLAFVIRPVRRAFPQGTDVLLEFSLKNVSKYPVLATREASLHDLIYLAVVDRAGEQVPWHGKVINRAYPTSFFIILEPGQSTTFRAVISLPEGGYDLQRPGTYRVRAEFSISPKPYFAAVAHGAMIPERPVCSNWAKIVITRRTTRN
jgi:hypothetical protein